ncbi:GntP family permease [Paraglaciecola hydrolytica]|uniref:Gluconate transporter n=1 Tax=Paraglaciecola hydrolytica TaxID=1799789 RepID=A0A148KLZ5_9ALTE|nr:GntP family permease [Paraglaciecola hydrolytica]KXI27344.1 gluconate transporter [Paraglaciecola hydrolytica]
MLILWLILSVVAIVGLTTKLKVHPFIALLLVALAYGFVAGMPSDVIITSVNEGFGKTLGSIGLLIVLGVIIGAFMESSGAAYTIADWVLSKVGRKRVPQSMGLMGYLVSIPVYADSGFLLLQPLNKSLSKKAKISLSGSAIALAMGLTASHTMVPPTPGPIAAAGILEADLGLVLALGIPVSLFALFFAILFAVKYVGRTYIDPNPQISEKELATIHQAAPRLGLSALPILVPIGLILLRSLSQALEWQGMMSECTNFLGTPFVALLIGVFLALLLPKKLNCEMLSSEGLIGKAIMSASSILLITGAGGIFGKVLQNSGIADLLAEVLSGVSLGIFLPFLLAAAIKSAQGSSTVALITTASIIAPLSTTLGFVDDWQKAMLVIAIGAGSAVVSHANDSFFWVVTQMSGMDVKQGYRMHSLGTLVLGGSAICGLFIIDMLF